MTIRPWVKVAVCLVVLDLLLSRAGWLWRLRQDFGEPDETNFREVLGNQNWQFLTAAARDFETGRVPPNEVVAVGSSVVIFGMNETLINKRLQHDGTPVEFRKIATHGATATDSAILAWNSRAITPWLVIYGVAVRDFPKAGSTDSSVARIFYDSSIELPRLPRRTAEAVLDAHVKRYWKLYRYRFFARTALETAASRVLHALSLSHLSFADEVRLPPGLPVEATHYFSVTRVTPESYAAWVKWRETRRFSDYMTWMDFAPHVVLDLYKAQTPKGFGPEGNLQVESLRWMLSMLRREHTRTVLLFLPENPVFSDPEARIYFDPALSDAYAALFAREANATGARFEDLRKLADPEEFYDLIHLNLVGERKLSERVAQIIEEEWRARTAAGD